MGPPKLILGQTSFELPTTLLRTRLRNRLSGLGQNRVIVELTRAMLEIEAQELALQVELAMNQLLISHFPDFRH
jgi:hypothetical protein